MGVLVSRVLHHFHALFLELKVVLTQDDHVPQFFCLLAGWIAVQLLLTKPKKTSKLNQQCSTSQSPTSSSFYVSLNFFAQDSGHSDQVAI